MPTFTVAANDAFSEPLILSDEDEHHLTKVLRVKIGEIVQLNNGRGKIAVSKVSSLKPLALTIESVHDAEKPTPVIVALPLIRQERLEWAVEKLAELNVVGVQLYTSDFCRNEIFSPSRHKRLVKIIEAAQKQSGRGFPLILSEPKPLKILITEHQSHVLAIPGSMSQTPKFTESLQKATQPLLLWIGPEGGFSEAEEKTLLDLNPITLSLGKTLLRTETAALAAVSVMKMGFSD